MRVFVFGFEENWHIFIEHRVQQELGSCLVSMSLLTYNVGDEMGQKEDWCRFQNRARSPG